jgi:hypothetical protein
MLHEELLVDAPERPEVTSQMRRVAERVSVIHFTLPGQALDLTSFTQSSNIQVQLASRLTKRDLIRTEFLRFSCCEPESAQFFCVLKLDFGHYGTSMCDNYCRD